MHGVKWSKAEKATARRAFEAAYRRECEAIVRKVREMAQAVGRPEDLWAIHDFLTEQRKAVDRKYDYRYSVLIHVFATLLREGWLREEDLKGLDEEKTAEIRGMAEGRW